MAAPEDAPPSSPPPPLEVAAASAADLTSAAEDLAAQPLLRHYRLAAAPLAAAWQHAQLRGEHVLVGRAGGQLAGLCWFSPRGAFAAPYLNFLGVLQRWQGRGIGGALLDVFEAAAQPAPRGHFLLVSAHNAAARRFYGRRGYAEVGALNDFLQPGTRELVYHRRPADKFPATAPPPL